MERNEARAKLLVARQLILDVGTAWGMWLHLEPAHQAIEAVEATDDAENREPWTHE